ncbi:MAG: segregation/condensation protein A [Firmicutes bacterium]|nr:segregation/condensation protein A [Bacillota bacterium]
MGYVIELEVYQGPFDLLLDLITQNEVDIWDIPIATITEQYLDYLHSLQEMDLAITGEFLVMAATLIRIKSRLLLPQESVDTDDPEESEDPRTELVEQLLRYKFFKEVAEFLRERHNSASSHYTKGQPAAYYDLTPIYTNPVGDVTVNELSDLYYNLFKELETEEPVHTISAGFSMEERLALVRLQLVGKPRLSFFELLRDESPTEIVGTFLAVLELVRLGEINVVQSKMFGEISIEPFALELEVNA